MNMLNITFEIPSSFVFKKSSEKKIFTIIFVGMMFADGGPTLFHNLANVLCYLGSALSENKASPTWQSEQTRDNHPILFQCWSSVEDCGPTLKQHWVNSMCLLMPAS